ncbi:MAG TPA: hypothetical protein VLA34_14990, partial [Candidatus Krumholzibacterium sp.]|nr:hypothetical protein [Candidatus Krumholzibacterium sp.]
METTQSRTPDAPFQMETNDEHPPSAKRLFRLGFTIVLMGGLATVFWLVWSIQLRETSFEASLEKRLELLAASRAEVLSIWLTGLAEQGDRVIQSDLFRL